MQALYLISGIYTSAIRSLILQGNSAQAYITAGVVLVSGVLSDANSIPSVCPFKFDCLQILLHL